jgi:hypothetical protein
LNIGKYLIQQSIKWKPEGEKEAEKIGALYGFDLYIRHQKELMESDGALQYHHYNTFYAQNGEGGIKYTYNNGHINSENPKLAARYFLNAIDRVSVLREKYEKTLEECTANTAQMEMLIQKPFEKEAELSELKKELATLEREILQTIKAKAMGAEEHYQDQGFENTQKQAPVIKLDDFGNPALLQKKVSAGRTKGLHM